MRTRLRKLLTALLVASSVTTVWMIWTLAQQPLLTEAIGRSSSELRTVIETSMAKHVTQETIEARLRVLLAEAPRNWVAIDSIVDVARERELSLESALEIETSRAKDKNWMRWGALCASCVWDISKCDLSSVLFCRVGDLTPIGDVVSVARESGRYVTEGEFDGVDLTLSAAGLAAVAAAPVTGGASLTAKVGTSFVKTARRMGKLSEQFTAMIVKAARSIEWKAVAKARNTDDVRLALQTPEALTLKEAVEHTGAIHEQLGLARSLHVIQYIDSASDARQLRKATDALGHEKLIGRLELLGKGRILRATMRYADEVWILVSAIAGLLVAIIGLFWSVFSSISVRIARRTLRDRRA